MEWRATRRGAIVAFLPFLLLLSLGGNFFVAAILSVPFLVMGARIERDGDWSSPRRVTTLFGVAALELVAFVATDGLLILGFLVAPVVGVLVWFAAGPG